MNTQRVADAITSFAGNMKFVYLHAILFALWCGTGLLGKDPYPYGLLTMAVSLEAIFLSTFVMIGQNRAADLAAQHAEHSYTTEHALLTKNTDLTTEIHRLTSELHAKSMR